MIKLEKPVRKFLTELIASGVAHHAIIVHGDCAQQLKQTAQQMRIEVLEL